LKIRPKHYWRRHLRQVAPERFALLACYASGTIVMLSGKPQPSLSWFGRFIAFLTTPFKRLGISGWRETGCDASACGQPVRDAQHSTDGFWTIDVQLEALAIGSTQADLSRPRYLRLKVEPKTAAHDVCRSTPILQGTPLAFGGAVVIDTDGPFLGIPPGERLPDRRVEAYVRGGYTALGLSSRRAQAMSRRW
jgi:hypothetical protein